MNEKEIKKQSKILMILFGFTGVFMVVTLIATNFTTKGTYSMSDSYTGINEATANTLRGQGYTCTEVAQDPKWTCTCANDDGCAGQSKGKTYSGLNESAANTLKGQGYNCTSVAQESKWNCVCPSNKTVTASGCVANSSNPSSGTSSNPSSKPSSSSSSTPSSNPSSQTSCGTESECQEAGKNAKCPYGYTCSADTNGCYKVKCNTNQTTNYTISFMNAEGNNSLGSCQINSSTKKIDSSTCTTNYSSICSGWSTTYCPNHVCDSSNNQSLAFNSSNLVNSQFEGNVTLYCKAGTSIHPGGNGSGGNGSGGNGSSGGGTTPSTPTTTSACYLVNHKYVWASSKPNGGTLVSSKTTSSTCNGCENGYAADSNNNCVKPGSSSNVPSNPQTGGMAIIFAWTLGIIAIIYSFWYFKESNLLKNK